MPTRASGRMLGWDLRRGDGDERSDTRTSFAGAGRGGRGAAGSHRRLHHRDRAGPQRGRRRGQAVAPVRDGTGGAGEGPVGGRNAQARTRASSSSSPRRGSASTSTWGSCTSCMCFPGAASSPSPCEYSDPADTRSYRPRRCTGSTGPGQMGAACSSCNLEGSWQRLGRRSRWDVGERMLAATERSTETAWTCGSPPSQAGGTFPVRGGERWHVPSRPTS